MKYLFIVFACVISIHCSTQKSSAKGKSDKLIEMSKSPCFGYCPTYDLTIHQDGLMKLNAKQNMKVNGILTKKLDKKKLADLKKQLEKLKLAEYKDEYKEPVADAPSTKIIYYNGQIIKSIYTNFQYPAPLQKFSDYLDSLTLEEGWIHFTDVRLNQEYILLLQEGKVLYDVIKKYESYELVPVKKLDQASGQYWLMSAKVSESDKNILLSKLKSDPFIKTAQFNKEVEIRK